MKQPRFQAYLLVLALSVLGCLASPLQKSAQRKAARQVEFTTPAAAPEARTGYPEAGFRPDIPFELPHEFGPKAVTEAVETFVPVPATTTTAATVEDIDEFVPSTSAPEVESHTPADTYGAPAPPVPDSGEVAVEDFAVEADVVPVPSEDFQPPVEEVGREFSTSFGDDDNSDGDTLADFPAHKQANEETDVAGSAAVMPADTYGAPTVPGSSSSSSSSDGDDEPSTDVETVEREFDGVANAGSAENKEELDGESRVQVPADSYGAPRTEENELVSELAEVEQQIEILSRLTQNKNGRLVILPVQNNLYLGRLLASQPIRRTQRQNGRLLRL